MLYDVLTERKNVINNIIYRIVTKKSKKKIPHSYSNALISKSLNCANVFLTRSFSKKYPSVCRYLKLFEFFFLFFHRGY